MIAEAGQRMLPLLKRKRVVAITDANVARHHLEALERSVRNAGIAIDSIVLDAGEQTKSFAGLEALLTRLLELGIERRTTLVALGGGVIGDLAGFASGIVRRGMGFVQVPTTLLAQVDSSVGGKTGVNTRHGKNLVGAFHQPSLVLADTAALDTLPLREMRAGYAEVVKYGLISDERFFEWCEANWRRIFAGGPERDHAVAESCRAKAAVVVRDEREDGERALLNLGHTFAHALERVTGYDAARLVHGEAVAIGMCLAFRFSVRLGLCPGQDAGRLRSHIASVGLPTSLAEIPGGCGPADGLVDAMAQDKKVKDGALTFILARGIGQSFIARGVAAPQVRAFLTEEIAG
ncbi:MAG: 3-dehydroquinate synthase [Microvirga sp.]